MFRKGDYVRWNPLIAQKFQSFPNPNYWEGEPLSCLMEVREGKTGTLFLDCANSCGMHSIEDITEEEFSEYSSILGGKALLSSSISEELDTDFIKGMLIKLGEEEEEEVEEYDPELDIQDFIEENAPKYVERLLKQ